MAARGWRLSSTAFEFAKKNCTTIAVHYVYHYTQARAMARAGLHDFPLGRARGAADSRPTRARPAWRPAAVEECLFLRFLHVRRHSPVTPPLRSGFWYILLAAAATCKLVCEKGTEKGRCWRQRSPVTSISRTATPTVRDTDT